MPFPFYPQLMKTALILPLLLGVSFTAWADLEAPRCAQVLLGPVVSPVSTSIEQTQKLIYGDPLPGFIKNHSGPYTREVKNQAPIHNQCALGVCHLNAETALYEQLRLKETGDLIELSTEYLAANFWIQEAQKQLLQFDSNASISLGSLPIKSTEFIRQVGLIPKEAWKSGVDFESDVRSGQIMDQLNEVIAHTHLQLSNLDSIQLRQMAKEQRNKIYSKIIKNSEADIQRVFRNLLGDQPQSFMFRGQRYTPQTFAQTFFPQVHEPIFELYMDNPKAATFYYPENARGDQQVSASTENIIQMIRNLIDKNQNVGLLYDHDNSYVGENGHITIDGFYHIPKGRPLSQSLRQKFGFPSGGHMVDIVGYDLDPKTKHVTRFKIKNSWGTEVGESGYFHMHMDYFLKYAYGIAFPKKSEIPMPKGITIYSQDPQLSFDLPPPVPAAKQKDILDEATFRAVDKWVIPRPDGAPEQNQ